MSPYDVTRPQGVLHLWIQVSQPFCHPVKRLFETIDRQSRFIQICTNIFVVACRWHSAVTRLRNFKLNLLAQCVQVACSNIPFSCPKMAFIEPMYHNKPNITYLCPKFMQAIATHVEVRNTQLSIV